MEMGFDPGARRPPRGAGMETRSRPPQPDAERLRALLERLDGRGYKAYQGLAGRWSLGGFTLHVDHVQGDPFAEPSRLRVEMEAKVHGLPLEPLQTPEGRIATADFLLRQVVRVLQARGQRRRGTGHSGEIRVAEPGQSFLPRSAMEVDAEGHLTWRFQAGLPADGRTILGRQAAILLLEEIPAVVREALLYRSLNARQLRAWQEVAADQAVARRLMEERGLVAFVAEGSILPRRSGVSDLPLDPGRAVPFRAPGEMRQSFLLPHAGEVQGLAIPEGVTLITGGGFHGKSTLERAVELGVYDHIPGDGRELCLTRRDAVKVRAEDGRAVTAVDISPFIGRLPGGVETETFTTELASGSTSQAANIAEALEAGSRLLLMDEDTCATNFMVRDRRMQRLIPREQEPIVPFVDRVRQLRDELGVSTILVVGGVGDYLDVADHVIAMREFRPAVITEEARRLTEELPSQREPEAPGPVRFRIRRHPRLAVLEAEERRPARIRSQEVDELRFGRWEIDLGAVEQVVEVTQSRAIGHILRLLARMEREGAGGATPAMPELLEAAEEALRSGGWRSLVERPEEVRGDWALPRRYEIAAAINRFRGLHVDVERLRETF
ncbi:MAG: ABC-ATPase domain-containing protein [Bacillota bacterium]|nr:ABC-ATPase domain-containing protein [Bacillota bacterium]